MTKKLLFQNGLALFVCLFLFAGASFAQTKTATMVVTSSNPSWSVPNEIDGEIVTGVTSLTFEAWGGGGAGGYAYSDNILIRATGGGGGAAYARSATLTDVSVGEHFNITVGAKGTAVGNNESDYHPVDGGTSTVMRGSNLIVKAVGGKTVTGYQNLNGASGGDKDLCVGDFVASGGKGGNADPGIFESGARCISGSGGGAGGPGGDGGDAENSWLEFIIVVWRQWTGQPGAGNGSGAGTGGMGLESQEIGGGGWGNAQGTPGGNYGGGGSGSISNHTSAGDSNGGEGGNGAVRVTITYTTAPAESVAIADASANVCSGADFDVALNITADGFDMDQALVTTDMLGSWDLSISGGGATYNPLDGKWHITGSVTNFSSNTVEYSIGVTVKTPSENDQATATVKLNVYAPVNGGIIAKAQLVCADQTIEILKGDGSVVTDGLYYSSVTTAEASGGSGSGSYRWYAYDIIDGSGYELIASANEKNYMPTDNGYFRFKREFVDPVCGSAWATDGHGGSFLIVVTVNPFELYEYGFSEDTICSNENYTHNLEWEGYSPAAEWYGYGNWQESTDKGATWVDLASSSSSVTVSLTPDDFSAGDDIWYRFIYPFGDCDPIPGNSIHKIHVKEVPSYAGQFPDINITLWYGACDTSIAELVPPVLTPTPASITRTDDHGNRLIPGVYELTWSVIADDCNIPVTYTQNVIVEFPKCGTLEEPYVITDRYGYEYNTIRIGCDCWLAENLRTNADNATYYDNDDANEAFGRLYDWNDAVGSFNYEMETKLGTNYIQGVCPMGWAMPTVAQYNKVKEAAGSAEGVKSDDANAWLPDLVGTNTVGFAAMGAGFYSGMEYQRLLGYTDFWTADDNESNSSVAKAMELRPGCDELLVVDKNKADKLSVRCVRVEPLSYININIAFDMEDEFGDGWDGGAYLLAEYGGSSVKLFLDREHGTHFENTLPVPQGSDVTLTWSQGNSDYEISITVTNTETEEVLYHIEDLSGTADGEELTTFHVDGHSNPADLQLVDFVLKQMYSGYWNNGSFSSPSTGFLQVDYGTGVLNLSKVGYGSEDHAIIALPVGAHIQLNWIGYTTGCFFTVKYPDGTVIYDAPTVNEGPLYEFDVEKK